MPIDNVLFLEQKPERLIDALLVNGRVELDAALGGLLFQEEFVIGKANQRQADADAGI